MGTAHDLSRVTLAKTSSEATATKAAGDAAVPIYKAHASRGAAPLVCRALYFGTQELAQTTNHKGRKELAAPACQRARAAMMTSGARLLRRCVQGYVSKSISQCEQAQRELRKRAARAVRAGGTSGRIGMRGAGRRVGLAHLALRAAGQRRCGRRERD